MRKTCILAILTVPCLLTIITTASAQMWPGRYSAYDSRLTSDDAAIMGALNSSAMTYATSQRIAQSNRLAGQYATMQQKAMVQSSARDMLAAQAETRTQEGQQNRDWWFQVQQQQQAAQRPSMAARPSTSMTAVGSFESPASNAAADIIKWPPVLCDTRFASQRAIVEVPYRRQNPGQPNPTVDDYRNMIIATTQMKGILGQMIADISAQDYLEAVKFLDQLAAEARGRIETIDAPAEQRSK